jgi:hypothetical protein
MVTTWAIRNNHKDMAVGREKLNPSVIEIANSGDFARPDCPPPSISHIVSHGLGRSKY